MNHRRKLLFVLACGLVGSLLSLWLLPPVVNDFGLQIFSRMRTDDLKSSDQASDFRGPVPKSIKQEKREENGPEKPPDGTEKKGDESQLKGGSSDTTNHEDGSGKQSPKTPDNKVNVPSAKQAGEVTNGLPLRSTAGVEDLVAETKFPVNPFAIGLFGFIVGMAIGSFFMKQGEQIADRWEKAPSGDKLTIMLGSLAGVIAGILVSMPFLIALQGRPEGALLTIGMVLGCSAAMIYLMRSLGPYLPWETSSMSKRTGLKILDTNVLIDGRVYDLIRTGFLDGDLYVPQFVLLELQHIADSADSLRRQRGRRGLDVLNRIRSEFEVEVGNRDRYAGNEKDEVDTRLMKLCKSLGADLVSNDYNLNRTASVQDIHVLNINDLALALRPNVLPGEFLEVQVMKEGNQSAQGVGYLDDGTMVVVEGGAVLIGTGPRDVVVTQVIQTERGKMIFANADPDAPLEDNPGRRRSPRGQR
ncbi:MAG: PIN/TRAM domain-containing protein [Fimbriimonadaceae bacterium]